VLKFYKNQKVIRLNILVTLDHGYIEPLRVMLASLCDSNPGAELKIFVAHISLTPADLDRIRSAVKPGSCEIVDVRVPEEEYPNLPFTKRWPKEACLRIFAAHILPDIDKILYLDPDLIVINRIEPLYDIDLGSNFFAASTHMFEPMQYLCRVRLKMAKDSVYINSGVMLMNLSQLRREQKVREVYDYVLENKQKLILYDQDILNGMYSDRTLAVDPLRYNLDDRYFKLYNLFQTEQKDRIDYGWVKDNTVILHFCGKEKPWNPDYDGKLGELFYPKYADMVK